VFRDQIKFLVENYRPISIPEFLASQHKPVGRYDKRPPVLLTFDDGFKNVIDQALPVLNEFGVPAAFFVLGAVVKEPGFVPWYVERIHILRRTRKTRVMYDNISVDLTSSTGRQALASLFRKSLRTCRSDQQREEKLGTFAELLAVARPRGTDLDDDLRFVNGDDLSKIGRSSLLTVGSHGMTHRFFDTLSAEEQFYELQESHDVLSTCTSSYFPAVAYPGGAFNVDTVKTARRIYKAGFATANRASYRNIYAYPRVGLGNDKREHVAYATSRVRLNYIFPLKRLLYTARILKEI